MLRSIWALPLSAALLLSGSFARAESLPDDSVTAGRTFAQSGTDIPDEVGAAASVAGTQQALDEDSDLQKFAWACGRRPPQAVPADASSSPVLWFPPAVAQWSRDASGQRSGIVNLYVHGRLADMMAALAVAGWEPSKPNNAKDDLKYVGAAASYGVTDALRHVDKGARTPSGVLNAIQEMPVSNEYLEGRLEVMAFEKNNRILGGRDHLRIFDLNAVDAAGLPLWGIAANRDVGLKLDLSRPKQGFLNHKIDPDTDPERDIVAAAFAAEPGSSLRPIAVSFPCPPPPDQAYSADGQVLVVTLSPAP